jgi:glyoxylase-like metal-dependent hydrolase (beta-lactamase superfamily II)
MTVQSFAFNPFLTNCYVIHEGADGVLIDPSCQRASEVKTVLSYVARERIAIRQILLTHGHLDHLFGCATLCEAFGVGFSLHRADEPLIAHAVDQAAAFGIPMPPPPAPVAFLSEGPFAGPGGATWQILHAPGHSPGSVCFFDAANGFVVSGDVLFRDSIGRTDLWQGSLPQLMASIFQKLLPLGDDIVVYPGHGPETTIGRERLENPFLVTEQR